LLADPVRALALLFDVLDLLEMVSLLLNSDLFYEVLYGEPVPASPLLISFHHSQRRFISR